MDSKVINRAWGTQNLGPRNDAPLKSVWRKVSDIKYYVYIITGRIVFRVDKF